MDYQIENESSSGGTRLARLLTRYALGGGHGQPSFISLFAPDRFPKAGNDAPRSAQDRRPNCRGQRCCTVAAVRCPVWATKDRPGKKVVEGAQDDRLRESYDLRVDAARLEIEQGAIAHPANADEAQFPNGIANFTKGLPHDQLGETDVTTYQNYLTALRAGSQAALAELTLGGEVPLVNPLAGLAFDLEGADSHQVAIPPAPSFSRAQRAAEMLEVYWQALLRDLPFSEYSTNPIAQVAAAELSALAAFTGPRDSQGKVTAATLFRGFTAGDLIGPYVSQLLLKPFSYGAALIGAGYKTE